MHRIEILTPEWVNWFNNKKLFESIGDIPPREFED